MSDVEQSSSCAPSKASQTVHGALFAALVIFSTLNYVVPNATNVLGLVVVNTILSNSYVWNLVTASFFETEPLKLAFDALALYFVFKTVSYPSIENFVTYLGITLLSCTILTSTYCIMNYFLTADPTAISAPMYGFGGVLMAVLTYARQGKGRESIAPISISFHNLPALLIICESLLWIFGFGKYTRDLPFVIVSLFTSWSYLRFYARSPTGEVGNHSENFSFVSMFPERLHIVLSPLFTAFYNIAAIVGLYPKLAEPEKRLPHHLRFDNAGTVAGGVASLSPAMAGGVPGAAKTASEIASDRRRAKALKLLDAKMAELSSKDEENSWGDEEQPQA